MAKKEIPTIKKIVDCPKCGAKMEVEFEIDLDLVIPATLAGALAKVGKLAEEKEEEEELVPIPSVKEGMKDYGG